MEEFEFKAKLIKQELDEKRKKQRIKELKDNIRKEEKDFDDINKNRTELLINTTTISGTVFSAGVAIALNNSLKNSSFILGEFFILLATLAGAIFLWVDIKGKELSHFSSVRFRLQMDLITNKDIISNFEETQINKSITEYTKLMEKKSVLEFLLRIVKIDYIPSLNYIFLFIGLFLIWLSLFGDLSLFNSWILIKK